MNNTLKKELLFRLSEYIGAFAILDAMRPGTIQLHQVQTFLDRENRLIETIDEAKCLYAEGGNIDKNLYSLIVGAESAIKAANEAIQSDGKSYCYSFA